MIWKSDIFANLLIFNWVDEILYYIFIGFMSINFYKYVIRMFFLIKPDNMTFSRTEASRDSYFLIKI